MVLFFVVHLFSWRVVVISGYICSLGWFNADKSHNLARNLLYFKRQYRSFLDCFSLNL